MFKGKFSFVVACFFLYTFFNAQLFAAKYHSVEDMLSAQNKIRVLIDVAPGFGNQAATVNMMNRMRQLHFKGTYEIIYPDIIKDKVISLFNLPKLLPEVYHFQDANGKIDFILESYYIKQLNNNLVEPISLGFSGAHDSDAITNCYDQPNCDSSRYCEDEENCNHFDNFAEYTNAKVYVELQPWYDQDMAQDYIAVPNTDEKIAVEPRGKYLIYPFAKFADAKNYLENTQAGRDFELKHPGLQTLVNRISRQEINFLSVYGYAFLKQYNSAQEKEYPFPQNILQVLTAARVVQLSEGQFAKPIVVAVYYNYKTEIDELNGLLNSTNWGEYEASGGPQARDAINAVKLNDSRVFSMASVGDPDVNQKIKSLAPGQVLLLATGPLPKVVFDGLYSYTGANILPAIREGEGTLSMLLQTGLPHFRCTSFFDPDEGNWELGFDLVKDPKLKQELTSFYGENGFCDIDSWKNNPGIYKKLGGYMIDAKKLTSPISKYFTDLKADTANLRNDRIYRGLEEAVKVIE